MRVAILDDVERVALSCADWRSLGADEVVALERHLEGPELAELLAGFDVLVVQRERTRIDSALLAGLPALRLIVPISRPHGWYNTPPTARGTSQSV